MLFKISNTSTRICDILKHALATHSWQCRGSGQLQLLPNHTILDFTDAKRYYNKEKYKIQQFFPVLVAIQQILTGRRYLSCISCDQFCLAKFRTFPISKSNLQKLCHLSQFLIVIACSTGSRTIHPCKIRGSNIVLILNQNKIPFALNRVKTQKFLWRLPNFL